LGGGWLVFGVLGVCWGGGGGFGGGVMGGFFWGGAGGVVLLGLCFLVRFVGLLSFLGEGLSNGILGPKTKMTSWTRTSLLSSIVRAAHGCQVRARAA